MPASPANFLNAPAHRRPERPFLAASSDRRMRDGTPGGRSEGTSIFRTQRGRDAQAPCISCMFFIIVASVAFSSSVGLNKMHSLPASAD
jgi:hypothetical protein